MILHSKISPVIKAIFVRRNPVKAPGFTLIELAVSTAVLTIILLVLVGVTNQTSSIWRRTTSKVEQFRDARTAFESMSTRISQATLNTYLDYDNPTAPTKFERRSELRFVSGLATTLFQSTPLKSTAVTHAIFFQAPFGVTAKPATGHPGTFQYEGFENLLCSWGYYLNYDSDQTFRPAILPTSVLPLRYRYRLMELWQPAEQNFIYTFTSNGGAGTYRGYDWFTNALTAPSSSTNPTEVHVLAENIIALILTPRLSPQDEQAYKGSLTVANADYSPLAPKYSYDTSPVTTSNAQTSDNRLNPVSQLPPLVQVTMVALDETSASLMTSKQLTGLAALLGSAFQDTSQYSTDLLNQSAGSNTTNSGSLETYLIQNHLNYRIFNTNVMIRGAKWSRTQSN